MVSGPKVYVRPMAPIATAACQGGPPVLAAGGRNDVRFTAAEIIDRGGGEIRRRIVGAAELLADARPEVQACSIA